MKRAYFWNGLHPDDIFTAIAERHKPITSQRRVPWQEHHDTPKAKADGNIFIPVGLDPQEAEKYLKRKTKRKAFEKKVEEKEHDKTFLTSLDAARSKTQGSKSKSKQPVREEKTHTIETWKVIGLLATEPDENDKRSSSGLTIEWKKSSLVKKAKQVDEERSDKQSKKQKQEKRTKPKKNGRKRKKERNRLALQTTDTSNVHEKNSPAEESKRELHSLDEKQKRLYLRFESFSEASCERIEVLVKTSSLRPSALLQDFGADYVEGDVVPRMISIDVTSRVEDVVRMFR